MRARRAPLFAATIIATFALGIAANTAIFSVMDALVLRPLAVPELERVVTVAEQRGEAFPRAISYADYEGYRRQSHAFVELAAKTRVHLTATLSGASESIQATRTTANVFALFGVQPQLLQQIDSPARQRQRIAPLALAAWAIRGSADHAGDGPGSRRGVYRGQHVWHAARGGTLLSAAGSGPEYVSAEVAICGTGTAGSLPAGEPGPAERAARRPQCRLHHSAAGSSCASRWLGFGMWQ